MNKINIILIFFAITGCFIKAKSQVTATLYPTKDAYLLMSLRPGSEYIANTNYGTLNKFYSGEWTSGGYRVNERSLIDFNFSAIPSGAVILEARLSLYAMQPQTSDDYRHVSYAIKQSTTYKSNASYLERVIYPWTESGVTYNTQPVSVITNRVLLPESTAPDQNYINIDISKLVQDIVDNPSSSFGMILKLQNEQKYTRMAFCSRDHDDVSRRPILFVKYVIPTVHSVVTIGEGTSVTGTTSDTEVTPFGTYWHDNKSQYLFTTAELNAAGMTKGLIYTIDFDVASYGGRNLDYMEVHLGHTTQSSLSSFVSGLSNVFDGSYNITVGWNKILFDIPFEWDGISNLVVQVCFDNNSYTQNSTVRYTSTPQIMVYGEYQDGSSGCSSSMNNKRTSYKRPNMRFNLKALPYSNFDDLSPNNYIFTREILHHTSQVETSYRENFQYFDGLGRIIQNVDYMASPLGNDIVQPFEYDTYGREVKKYMPYTEIPGGIYRDDWESKQEAFYTNTMGYGMDDGSKAFSETVFDNSPITRVMKQGAPGNVWQVVNTTPFRQSSEHVISNQYSSNIFGEAYYWTISGTYPNVTFSRYTYGANNLYKTIVSDENNNPITEYKDLKGKVVLKVDALEGKTYYIYDNFDLLRCVIAPLASQTLAAPAKNSFTLNEEDFKQLCYYYEYDYRHRMTKKKLPGTIGIYEMTYDSLDRLIETKDPNETRIYTKYDIFSRPIVNGNAATSTWLTKTHYDTYLKNGIQYDEINTLPYVGGYGYTRESMVRGKITVTVNRVINPVTGMKDSIRSVTYYDKYGRVIQIVSDNHLGGRDIVSHLYCFKNSEQISRTKYQHWKNSYVEGSPDHEIEEVYTYDHTNRIKSTDYVVNGHSARMSELAYYENGTLKTKKIGDALQTIDYKYNIRRWLTQINNPTDYGVKLFSMKLDYLNDDWNGNNSYNGNIIHMEWLTDDGYNKHYHFQYDNVNRLIQSNFREFDIDVELIDEEDKYYTHFTYDANGNIKTAQRYGIIIDGTGLIGLIDNLEYKYFNSDRSNRLWAVGDGAPDVWGRADFSEYHSDGYSNQEYWYDNNGTMKRDDNRYLLTYYNYLNLPYLVKDGYNHWVFSFSYSADGMKLYQKSYFDATTTEYIGPMVYKNGVLDYVITGEGRAVFANGSFSYFEYNLKDHLGNVRVTFRKNGTAPEILQTNDYYPFGMLMSERYEMAGTNKNKYLYNGKEILKTTHSGYAIDLSYYDYGARMYDPQLGRFHSIDPWAEIYDFQSPYAYGLNNPIRYTDYLGLGADDQVDKEERKRRRQERREERQKKKDESEIVNDEPFIIDEVVYTQSNKDKRRQERYHNKVERAEKRYRKYLKWLSEGKTRKADWFERWVLRNFDQREINNLINNWPVNMTPTLPDGYGEGGRNFVESNEYYRRGADRLNEKLKKKYGDNPETPATDGQGKPVVIKIDTTHSSPFHATDEPGSGVYRYIEKITITSEDTTREIIGMDSLGPNP